MAEVLLQGQWLKEIGNAQNAELKLTNFLSSQLKTDQFTAENVGKRRDLRDSKDNL